jgi:type IV secretion system protein VirB10
MAVSDIGDPRLQALFGANDPRDAGVRPTVRLPRGGLSPLVLAIGAILLGLMLFVALNSRRVSQSEPPAQTAAVSPGATGWAAPPPLYLPPEEVTTVPTLAPNQEQRVEPKFGPSVMPQPRSAPPQIAYAPQPMPQFSALPPQARPSNGAPLVIDTGASAAAGAGSATTASPLTGQTITRMRASALANRSTTVPQGTLIPAVLETGFNSSQPGYARAIVSRNVRSFDGTNILIPRGSRLIGEYHSDVGPGQKRAVIIWTRLIRPDGMTIAMDSPAVDTLGRGGVAASVNNHFFQRLGDALLQSTVGIGTALAQRAVTGPVVVISGNVGSAASDVVPKTNYVPTLSVPAGKSISVFVAHDLDFSTAGTPR